MVPARRTHSASKAKRNLGSHLASKPRGACSHSARAKILAKGELPVELNCHFDGNLYPTLSLFPKTMFVEQEEYYKILDLLLNIWYNLQESIGWEDCYEISKLC